MESAISLTRFVSTEYPSRTYIVLQARLLTVSSHHHRQPVLGHGLHQHRHCGRFTSSITPPCEGLEHFIHFKKGKDTIQICLTETTRQ